MLKDFLILCYILDVSCNILIASNIKTELEKYSSLSSACNVILKHGMERKTPVANVITDGSKDSHRVKDFRNELLWKFSFEFESALRVEESNKISILANRKKRCSFLIIDDFRNFLDIFQNISSEVFKPDGMFFIINLSGKIPEIAEMFKLMWKRQFFNVFVAYLSDEVVKLESFEPFLPGRCYESVPVLINEFVNGKFTKRIELFGRNMRNLNRCPLRVAFINTYEPYTFVRENPKSIADFSGEAINILKRLSASLNFSIEIAFLGSFGNIYPNGSSDGALGALIDKRADFSISNWWLITYRLKFVDSTYPYTCEPIVFALPTGRELSSLERLVYPFSYLLWIMIVLCFVIGFMVIFVINFRSTKVQHFVYGSMVQHPFWNMFTVFIGGIQPQLPRRNFSRFLLMNFLLCSLILRAIYQASSFQFLQSNAHPEKMKSINDLVENDYNFYVVSGLDDQFKGTRAK